MKKMDEAMGLIALNILDSLLFQMDGLITPWDIFGSPPSFIFFIMFVPSLFGEDFFAMGFLIFLWFIEISMFWVSD